LIQVVPDAYSVDALKKMHGAQTLSQVRLQLWRQRLLLAACLV
jgi:hypothetical protein